MSAIIYWQNPCKLLISFRCIKAYMLAFSGRFSRKCLKGISFNFFVCFIFNRSIGSAQKKKHQYLMLYQSWNRTPVYLEIAVSASYKMVSGPFQMKVWTFNDPKEFDDPRYSMFPVMRWTLIIQSLWWYPHLRWSCSHHLTSYYQLSYVGIMYGLQRW